MRRWALLAALSCVASSAWGQSSQHLARARQEIDNVRYERAAAALEMALRAGDAGPSAVAEIHLLRGRVAAALGRTAEAEEHFCHLLALDPGARLPAGVSPKLARPFKAAQDSMRARGHLRVRHQASGGEAPMAVVMIESDPLGMVARARLQFRTSTGIEQSLEAAGRGRIVMPLPRAPRVEYSIAVLDAHGNRLVEFGPTVLEERREPSLAASPAATAPPGERPGPATRSRSFVASPWLWGGAAAAFALTGMGFGIAAHKTQGDLDALNAQSRDHTYSEARTLQDRGERYAVLTDVAFAVAGACAVVATVLLIRDLRGRAERRRAALTLLPGGASLSLGF